MKKLADKMEKEKKAAKDEMQTWYTFATDTHTKLAQYLFYLGEIDKSLMQQRDRLTACEQAIKENKKEAEAKEGIMENLKKDVEIYLAQEVNKVHEGVKADGQGLPTELKKGADGALRRLTKRRKLRPSRRWRKYASCWPRRTPSTRTT